MCRFCGWEGTHPARDAHGAIFCPECGRPADYKLVVEQLKKAGLWRASPPD